MEGGNALSDCGGPPGWLVASPKSRSHIRLIPRAFYRGKWTSEGTSQYDSPAISGEMHEMMGSKTKRRTSGAVVNGEQRVSIESPAIRHGK